MRRYPREQRRGMRRERLSRPFRAFGRVVAREPGAARLAPLCPGLSNLAPFGAFIDSNHRYRIVVPVSVQGSIATPIVLLRLYLRALPVLRGQIRLSFASASLCDLGG